MSLADDQYIAAVDAYCNLCKLTVEGPWESPMTKLYSRHRGRMKTPANWDIALCIKKWAPLLVDIPGPLKARAAYIFEAEAQAITAITYSDETFVKVGLKAQNFDIGNLSIVKIHFPAIAKCLRELGNQMIPAPKLTLPTTLPLPIIPPQTPTLPRVKYGDSSRVLDLD